MLKVTPGFRFAGKSAFGHEERWDTDTEEEAQEYSREKQGRLNYTNEYPFWEQDRTPKW